MDTNLIAKKYVDAIKHGSISSTVLSRLPKLVTCSNWNNVTIDGRVDFISPITKVHYDGLLVHYNGGLYYMTKNVAEAVAKFDKRFKKVKSFIKVINE